MHQKNSYYHKNMIYHLNEKTILLNFFQSLSFQIIEAFKLKKNIADFRPA